MIFNLFFPIIISFFAGIILIPYLIKFSEKTHNLVDVAKGDELKIHQKPTSLFGGLAMFVSMIAGLLFLFDMKATGLILGAMPVFLLGVWDDIKWKHITTIKPLLKFFLLILSCLISAVILVLFKINLNFIPMPIIPVILSSAMIFVLINAVNYQDGMDGLAGSLVFISLLGFSILSFILGINSIFSVSLIVSVSIVSFLIFNLPTAKIFMGDSGAYLLGFILSALAITFIKPYNLLTILGVIFVMGVPLFDGVFTNIRRVIPGKSIFFGDRSHFYDRLMQAGFSNWQTLFICCIIHTSSVLIGILILIYA